MVELEKKHTANMLPISHKEKRGRILGVRAGGYKPGI